MFSERLLDEYEKGTPECTFYPSEVFEQAVDVRKFLEQWSDTSDLGGLAVALCQQRYVDEEVERSFQMAEYKRSHTGE